MLKEALTKQEAIRKSIEQWEDIVKNGGSKQFYFKRMGLEVPIFRCYLCEYTRLDRDTGDYTAGADHCLEHCPYAKKFGECFNSSSPYYKWENNDYATRHAKAFLKQLKSLRVPKVKRVYIAGALSTLPSNGEDTRTPTKVVTDYISNCSHMAEVARNVMERSEGRVVPYVPFLDFLIGFWSGDMTEEEYRSASMAFLAVCDYMLVISISSGVESEMARAKELGIPVVETIGDLLDLAYEGGV